MPVTRNTVDRLDRPSAYFLGKVRTIAYPIARFTTDCALEQKT